MSKPKRAPHQFLPDLGLPPDEKGRHVCSACHLIGTPDDAHHQLPVVPAQATQRGWYDPDDEGAA